MNPNYSSFVLFTDEVGVAVLGNLSSNYVYNIALGIEGVLKGQLFEKNMPDSNQIMDRIAVGIIVVLSMIFFIYKTNKGNIKDKPYLLSSISLSLFILNWLVYLTVLYLTDYYIVIPGKIGNFVFMPIWFIISIIGLIASYREFRNNRTVAIVVGGIAIINSIVGLVLLGMGNM